MQTQERETELVFLHKFLISFFQKELLKDNVILPRPDDYAVGMFFMPKNSDENEYCLKIVIKHLEKFGLEILHIRKVPVDSNVLGHSIKGK